MRYKAIYDVLEQSGSRITLEQSGWRAVMPTIVDRMRPLWIVAIAPSHNLRLWITHEGRYMSVTTARLDLDSKSREYHETQTRRDFRRQTEVVDYLRKILLSQEEEKCAS